MINKLFRKYLGRPAVQQGIISQVIASTIKKVIRANHPIHSDYYNTVAYVLHLTHEEKIQLYLQKSVIMSAAQKKLLEDFWINAIIKDIRIGNR